MSVIRIAVSATGGVECQAVDPIPLGWALPPDPWASVSMLSSGGERCACGRKSKVFRAAVHAPAGEPLRAQFACSVACIEARAWLTEEDLPMVQTNRMSRKIITLCGSTRFYDAFREAQYRLTMAGSIVLTVGFYPGARGPHGETIGCTPEENVALDLLHFDKILISDGILVLNVGGYVGESTMNEIALAWGLGVEVSWLEPELGSLDPFHDWMRQNHPSLNERIAAHRSAGRL